MTAAEQTELANAAPRVAVPSTDLAVFPLCLGGNVFGWTADEAASFAVLDAYLEAGGNIVDTADLYMQSIGRPGISESIIGAWMRTRGTRQQIIVATKVGKLETRRGLAASNVKLAVEESLRRLGTDYVDILYAHEDDHAVDMAETMSAFSDLVGAGAVRYLGASNFTAPRLAEALAVSDREGLARYAVIQPRFNVMDHDRFAPELAELCAAEQIGVFPYFALAQGFLTGKYRWGSDVDSPRSAGASAYLDARGEAVLAVLDELAATYETTVAAVSLAWLAAQPTVVAPIASARSSVQLEDLLPAARLTLEPSDVHRLAVVAEHSQEG
jgi:aryl-alcohol dehydrogenase-like predicted oxidoreductase